MKSASFDYEKMKKASVYECIIIIAHCKSSLQDSKLRKSNYCCHCNLTIQLMNMSLLKYFGKKSYTVTSENKENESDILKNESESKENKILQNKRGESGKRKADSECSGDRKKRKINTDSVSEKNAKYDKNQCSCGFQSHWCDTYSWLEYNEDTKKMFCSYCKAYPSLAKNGNHQVCLS